MTETDRRAADAGLERRGPVLEGAPVVGLTGNAGSGKSSVAAVWREKGVEIVDADALARELVDGDRELRRRLAVEFGEHVLEPSASADTGAVRREELARLAFASPERARALNRILHPPLLELLERRLAEARHGKARLVALDAALIFEAGVEPLFDAIVLVTAPPEQRFERLRRRGLEEGTIRGLFASQLPDAEKVARADHVIRNDGSLEALRDAALRTLSRLPAGGGGQAPSGDAASGAQASSADPGSGPEASSADPGSPAEAPRPRV